MDITLEQKIAVIRDTFPALSTLSDEQLKTQIESGEVANTYKSILSAEFKPQMLKEGKDSAFGEFGTALRKAAKEFDPEANTDADEWRDSPTKVLKRVLEMAKSKPIPPANIDAIKVELEARLKEQYKPLEEKLSAYETKVQEYEQTARQQQRKGVLDAAFNSLNVLKDSPKHKYLEQIAQAKLAGFDFENVEGVGMVLKDKDGNFAKDGNKLQTIEAILLPIAQELDLVKRSDTANPPPIVPFQKQDDTKKSHPNSYAEIMAK